VPRDNARKGRAPLSRTENPATVRNIITALQLPKMSTTKLITLTECAARVGVSVRTVQAWICAGKICGVYTGVKQKRAMYVTEQDAERMARNLYRKGGAK